jgi:hypothetical protein
MAGIARRLVARLFPPAEVEWTKREILKLASVEDFTSVEGILATRRATLQGARNADQMAYSIRVLGYTPKALAAYMVSMTSFELLGSGQYHVYRNVLNGDGHALHALFFRALSVLVEEKKVTEEEANQRSAELKTAIAEVG